MAMDVRAFARVEAMTAIGWQEFVVGRGWMEITGPLDGRHGRRGLFSPLTRDRNAVRRAFRALRGGRG